MGGRNSGFGVWWVWDGLWIAGLLVVWCLLVIGGFFFFFSPCFVGGFCLGGVCVMVGGGGFCLAGVCGGGGCYLTGYVWLWLWLMVEVVVIGDM